MAFVIVRYPIDNLLVASVVAGIPSTLIDVLASLSVALEARQTPAEIGADDVAASGVARARGPQEERVTLVDVCQSTMYELFWWTYTSCMIKFF